MMLGGVIGGYCATGRLTTATAPARVMTMDSTALRADTTGDQTSYPLDPLTGAEIQSAAAIVKESEYSTPTTRFVMIQLAEPDKTAELTFEGVAEVPRRAFITMYDAASLRA